MKTLIWKEYREKRNWFWLLFAAIIFPALVFCFQTPFVGELSLRKNAILYGSFNIFINIAALSFGLITYKNDITADTACFLMARPINWKKILLAKVFVGLSILLISISIGAIIYLLSVPNLYRPAMEPISILDGIFSTFLISSLYYFAGFASSILLPGFLGSLLVFIVNLALPSIIFIIIEYFRMEYKNPFLPSYIAIVTALILISRFGITLPFKIRAMKYTMIVLAIVIPLVIFLPEMHIFDNSGWEFSSNKPILKISPSAKTVCAYKGQTMPDTRNIMIRKLSDKNWTIIKNSVFNDNFEITWVYSDRLLTRDRKRIALYWLDQKSILHSKEYNAFDTKTDGSKKSELNESNIINNQDKTSAMIVSRNGNVYYILGVLDFKTVAYHKYAKPIILSELQYYGWLNNKACLFSNHEEDKFALIDFSNMNKPVVKNISLDEVKKLAAIN